VCIGAGWSGKAVIGRQHSLATNLIAGVAGAFLGGFLADVVDLPFGGFWGGLAISTLGAIAVMFMVSIIWPRRTLRRAASDE
jgi:uncharacterized membrane protein YeaQ/YmgE (transglycosylase-associated protein family)